MKEIKNVNINKNIDERQAIKNSGNIANTLAKEYNAENVKDFMEKTNEEMNSKNVVTKNAAQTRAASFVKDLALLLLYQVVIDSNSISYMNDFTNLFNDGTISEGNAKEYIVTLDTGHDAYKRGAFIPEDITEPLQEFKIIQMYKDKNVLSDNAYQFKKSLTISEAEWLPYFKSGELKQFIDNISSKMIRTYDLFKFNLIANLLTSLKPQKVLQGKETNIFNALSNEVFPEIENMIKYNKEYNISNTSDYVDTCNESDLVIVVGNRLLSRLKNGVESQLFNAQFFGPNSKPYMITSLNNKLNIGNSKTQINTSSEQYVNDDTIYVFDKNLIKSLIQVERNESQAWAENMTIQLTLHVWGVIDFLPWIKIFKYVNPNLEILP